MLGMDYSIRIPASEERIIELEERAVKKEQLTRVEDYVFKPEGIELKDFHPEKVCVRLRRFLEGDKEASLEKITTTLTELGYTDEKEKLGEGEVNDLLKRARELGYEKWGEFATVSVQYSLNLGGEKVQVLLQELRGVGRFLKIEAGTQDGLNKALEVLQAGEEEKIEKNAAVLLGEKLGLI